MSVNEGKGDPPERIRITHLITDLSIGGAEMVLFRLVSRSDGAWFAHRVVSLTTMGPVGKMLQDRGIDVASLGLGPRSLIPGLWRLREMLRQSRPHILQTWLPHADLVGLLIGRASHVPAITWNIRSSFWDIKRYSRHTAITVRTCAWLSRLPNSVVFNSRAGVEYFRSIGYRPAHSQVIPNGFDLTRFAPSPTLRAQVRASLGLSNDTPLVGLVARLDPMKDHETFLRAAARLRAERPEVQFLLVGTNVFPEHPWLRRNIEQLGLAEAVHLLGERTDVQAIYNSLDIATLCSYGEGFPNVIGEAMACGVPCVVTDVGDASVIVGPTGIVVPPRDPERLADGWLRLLDLSGDERHGLGSQARERIAALYSLEQMVRRYEALYKQLAQHPGRRPLSGTSQARATRHAKA